LIAGNPATIYPFRQKLVRRAPHRIGMNNAVRRDAEDTGAMAEELTGVLVAVLGGAAIGIERQWSGHAEGPTAHFAGVRTFAMLGAIAGLAGWLSNAAPVIAATLVAGAVGLTVAAYVASSRRDVDGTTEVAAVLLIAAGVLSGMGRFRLASGIIASEVLLLVEKSRLHSLVRRIDDGELRAGVRFAVMALVILPLLPEGPYGPYAAVQPRQIWLLVLFFSGLSFVGHVLQRNIGASRGYLVTGALGGIISSTNVTFTFARASRREAADAPAIAAGAIAANVVLYLRVCAAIAVLNVSLPPGLVVAAALAISARRSDAPASSWQPLRNPLQVVVALQMAALFQGVLIVVRAAQATWGTSGILTTAAILGLTDVDALSLSMARGVASLETAALAIAVGVLANTVLKAAVATIFGARQFALRVAGALVVSTAVGIGMILVL
jgi:uncharacterized membrane protein (DUF4010 family)